MLPLMPVVLLSTLHTLAAERQPRDAEDNDAERTSTNMAKSNPSLRFVHFVGFWSHFSDKTSCSTWPLPHSERLEDLAEFAERHGVLVPTPLAGDVFLLASASADHHVLAGFVADVERTRTLLNGCPAFVCTTIEGELGAPTLRAEAPSISARLVRRQLSPHFGDCFIRWCELDVHASEVTVEYEVSESLIVGKRADHRPVQSQEAA